MSLFKFAQAIGQARPRQKRLQPPQLKAPTGAIAATAKPQAPTPAKSPAPRPQRPQRSHSNPVAVSILAITTGGKAYDATRERLASNPKVSLQDATDVIQAAWSDDARSRVSLVGM